MTRIVLVMAMSLANALPLGAAELPAAGSAFTKITTGAIVTDGGTSFGCSWGDFDDDGNVDLFVANAYGQSSFLYRNVGDGTFFRVMSGPVVETPGDSSAGVWGDYDNDGGARSLCGQLGVADSE